MLARASLQDQKSSNREYAWVLKGERSNSRHAFLRGRRISTVGDVSKDGVLAHASWEGSIDGDRFYKLVTEILVGGLLDGCMR